MRTVMNDVRVTETIAVKISKDLRNRLEAHARTERRSLSQFVRLLLETVVEKEPDHATTKN